MSLTLPKFSPTKVGAQFLRHQLRAKARSMGGKFLAFKTHSRAILILAAISKQRLQR